MTTQEVKRKLTAILSADVKGYSRLMGEDEKGTVHTLNAYKELMANLIQQHHGRVVDATGDNLMAEFASVVDAVECAVDIQKELKTRNAELPENRRMEFRIGVNLGDVIEEEGRIYGDGVNIAARLESLSEAGGICISGTAFDHVRTKVNLGYEYLGEQTVKNIALPARVYKILMEPEAAGKVIGEKKTQPRQWQTATMGLVIAVIVTVATVVIWKLFTSSAPKPEVVPKEKVEAAQPEKPPATLPPSSEPKPREKVTPPSPEKVSKPAPPSAPKMGVASKDKMAFPLPDLPSIAVLPFVNMSEDPKQEYFCDGLAEEIINALARVPQVHVIARNSSFTYKGKAVEVKQVGREMGVKYVLEGGVRREAARVRITAQLVDAATGNHVFSERFDRELKDIFALQDDITMKVLTAIQVKLTEGEQARMHSKGTKVLEAYLGTLEAAELATRLNKEDNALARKKCEEVLALDPQYARAWALLSTIYLMDFTWGIEPEKSLRKAHEAAQKAISLDETLGAAHMHLGFLYAFTRRYEEGIAESERAVQLDPGSASVHANLGRVLEIAGQPREALRHIEKAIRMNPIPPAWYWQHLGFAHMQLEQYEDTVVAFKRALAVAPKHRHVLVGLISTYALMGRMEDARAVVQDLLRADPRFSPGKARLFHKDEAFNKRFAEGVIKAGLK